MNREHTPNKEYLNYLDVLRLRNKQQLNESEKSENYHWKSLPLWTKLRSNNTKIISNATNEKLVNTTMKSGLWQRRSTSLSYQNSNSLRLTPPRLIYSSLKKWSGILRLIAFKNCKNKALLLHILPLTLCKNDKSFSTKQKLGDHYKSLHSIQLEPNLKGRPQKQRTKQST